MPTYTYECPVCEDRITEVLTLAEHETYVPEHCHKHMFQVFFPPQITTDIAPYKSMITGERIAGRRQHRDHLRAHGCIEVGNETPQNRKPEVSKVSRREKLTRQLGDMSDRQADNILKQLKKDLHV